jgi:3-hydroxyisobutyrate dehydrogenase-like beta-hydroxyacid dehydrogenase
MDIGFIGLGNMGFHMARRLVEAGHRLTVTDTRPEAVERLTRRSRNRDRQPADA